MTQTTVNPDLQAYLNDTRSKKKKRSHEETDDCKAYYEWTQFNHLLKGNVVHVPNEGKRPPHVGKTLKDMGLQPGFPDYLVFVATTKHFSLAIEMKTKDKKTSKMPQNQIDWLNKLNKKGWYAVFAFGVNHAIKITEDYLANRI